MSPWRLRLALQFSEGHRIASLMCMWGPQRLHGGGCLLGVLGNALQRGKNTGSAHGEERSCPSAYLMWGFYCWDMTVGCPKAELSKRCSAFQGPTASLPTAQQVQAGSRRRGCSVLAEFSPSLLFSQRLLSADGLPRTPLV